MSKIIATNNFKTHVWEVNVNDLGAFYVDLFIGFTDETPTVEFKGLQFKFELRQGDNIKQYGTYPPPGVRYVRSNQPYKVVERLNHLIPDETYTLYLWSQNDGRMCETTTEFTAPRPPRPFDSWQWNGEQWAAPVPYPEDGKHYVWDEASQTWTESSLES
jgi:hypothetical protein